MPAARIGVVWLAAIASACSLSLDGDHFRGEPRSALDGAPGATDARDPEDSRPPRNPDAGGEPEPDPDPDPDFECVSGPDTCKPKCEEDDCVIDCRGAATCEATCKQATCDIDCSGADKCDRVKCQDGSECLLDCSGAERCGFEKCDGQVTTCEDGVLACNRDCP